MAKNYTITKEEGIKRICEAIREANAISDAIDDEHLATNSTFSSVKINSLLSDIDTRVDKLENGSGSGSGSGCSSIDENLYNDISINVGRKTDTNVGNYSTTFGTNVEASGNYSHALGINTQAIGKGTFAGGSDSQAIGGYSFVYGDGLIARHSAEVAFGEYNQSNVDTLFSIGNGGFIGGEEITRRNAFEVTIDGGKLHGKDIVTDLIQRGTVSGTTISITFDKSFKDTPTVVCTVCNSSPSAYYISNKSTTGFTITSNASQTYDWIAIGDAVTE